MTAATFVPVSGDGVSIQQILPTGDNIEYGDINIQTLDAFGGTVDTYTYYGAEEYDEGSAAGWYTDDGLADAAFATGTGLWVAGLDGSALTFSGKVGVADVAVSLRQGSTATANMMPVSVNLQDILPEGDGIEYGDINIQTLDAFGGTIDTYTYYGAEEYDEGSVAGWYTDDGLADVDFAPGMGLWVAGLDGATITFPAPEL